MIETAENAVLRAVMMLGSNLELLAETRDQIAQSEALIERSKRLLESAEGVTPLLSPKRKFSRASR